MKKEDLPQEINTVADLLLWLKWYKEQYGPDVLIEVRYDSGYGYGYMSPSAFAYDDGKLRIEVS